MKKTLITILIFISLISVANAGSENYLQLRRGFGENDFFENYIILENNSLTDWAIGGKIVTLKDGLTILYPHVFYKGSESIQLGARYCHVSTGSESIGPAIRFIKKDKQFIFILDSTYFIDLKEKNDKLDTWAFISTANAGLYLAAEVWHYKYRGGNEYFHLRPFKLGYRAKSNPSPFVMLERKWVEWENPVDNIYVGLEMKF